MIDRAVRPALATSSTTSLVLLVAFNLIPLAGVLFWGWNVATLLVPPGSEMDEASWVRRILFGRSLQDPYAGFAVHEVKAGDTLSAIADQWSGDVDRFRTIFQANRHLLEDPDVIVPGQLLRIERNPVADDGPDPDPTYFYSSPKWPSSFRVVQVFEGGAPGCCVVARGNTLQIGSAVGDLIFPDDPLVADQHCLIEEQAGAHAVRIELEGYQPWSTSVMVTSGERRVTRRN